MGYLSALIGIAILILLIRETKVSESQQSTSVIWIAIIGFVALFLIVGIIGGRILSGQ